MDWLIWYDSYNKKLQNPDYANGYNIQTARYYQHPMRNNNQGLIKFERNNNKNLIPTKPRTLLIIFTYKTSKHEHVNMICHTSQPYSQKCRCLSFLYTYILMILRLD